MSSRRKVGLVLALAFVLRAASNLWLTNPTPILQGDSVWYHSSAVSIAAGEGYVHYFTRQPTAAWPPGYPGILAAVYSVLGADPSWAFLLNVVAGTLTCWLAGRIALEIAGPRAQLLATTLLAVAPSAVLFASLALTETVFTTIMTALLLGAIVLLKRASSLGLWFAWGIGVGLASLVRAEAVVLVAAPVLVVALSRRRVVAAVTLGVVTAIGVLAAEAPWLARNAMLFGKLVPVSTSFGRTFVIGHNPNADGDMSQAAQDLETEVRAGAAVEPGIELEIDRRLRDIGVDFALHNPGRELELIWKRFHAMYRSDRVWGEWYAPADASRVTPAAMETLGRLSNLFYWPLLLAALPSLLLFARPSLLAGRGSEPRLLLSLTVLAWTGFFVVILYGSQRFHFPLMPLFCVMAADTIVRFLPRRD